MLLLILRFFVFFWLLRFLNKLYLRLFQRLWLSHRFVDGLRYVWVDAIVLSGFIYLLFIVFARNQFKVIKILIPSVLISSWLGALWILLLCSICVLGNRFCMFWELQDVEEIIATFLWNALGLLIINTTPRHFLQRLVFIFLLRSRFLDLQRGWNRILDQLLSYRVLLINTGVELFLKVASSWGSSRLKV